MRAFLHRVLQFFLLQFLLGQSKLRKDAIHDIIIHAFHVFGYGGKLAVELCIIGFLAGTCVAFFVVLGDLGPAIAARTFQVENTSNLRQIFEIYAALLDANLKKMNVIVDQAVTLSSFIYISMGLLGYIAYCSLPTIPGNILVAFPSTILAESVKLCFLMSVAVSFPLCLFPCRASIHSLLYPSHSPFELLDGNGNGFQHGAAGELSSTYIPEGKFKVITFVMVFGSLLAGIYLPNIEVVLSLLGSTIGTIICVIFPAIIFVKVTTKNTSERMLAQVLFCIGIFMLVAGTYTNLAAMDHASNVINDPPSLLVDDKAVPGAPKLTPDSVAKSLGNLALDAVNGDIKTAIKDPGKDPVNAGQNKKDDLLQELKKEQEEQRKILEEQQKILEELRLQKEKDAKGNKSKVEPQKQTKNVSLNEQNPAVPGLGEVKANILPDSPKDSAGHVVKKELKPLPRQFKTQVNQSDSKVISSNVDLPESKVSEAKPLDHALLAKEMNVIPIGQVGDAQNERRREGKANPSADAMKVPLDNVPEPKNDRKQDSQPLETIGGIKTSNTSGLDAGNAIPALSNSNPVLNLLNYPAPEAAEPKFSPGKPLIGASQGVGGLDPRFIQTDKAPQADEQGGKKIEKSDMKMETTSEVKETEQKAVVPAPGIRFMNLSPLDRQQLMAGYEVFSRIPFQGYLGRELQPIFRPKRLMIRVAQFDFLRSTLGGRKLRVAASVNNVAEVERLLKIGVGPNLADERKRTALHIAASRGFTEVVRVLLQNGADPNAKDCVNNIPLHLAACTGNLDIVTLLLHAGSDVTLVDSYGTNPLNLARSRLKLLCNDSSLTPSAIKSQCKQIVEMLQAYLTRRETGRGGDGSCKEIWEDFEQKLKLHNTKEEIDGDILNGELSRLGSISNAIYVRLCIAWQAAFSLFLWFKLELKPTSELSIMMSWFWIPVTTLLKRHKHSSTTLVEQSNMKVKVLPALSDNYMYLIVDPATNDAAVVDPVEPASVLETVKQEGWNLKSVLTTHHHWDHAGGNSALVKEVPGIPVYGGDKRVDALSHRVSHGDELTIGSLNVKCLFTPCHTSGHICYYVTSPNSDAPAAVFTGDTLFIAGCGKFFEGTGQEMYKALIEILGTLPDDTQVYCGHEYTVSNLKFAQHVEPGNQDLKAKIEWAKKKTEAKEPTVPSTIGTSLALAAGGEKKINPFMRVTTSAVREHVHAEDAIMAMDKLRQEKNNFRG
ncbi:unnamed protein product [Darwinula stevensoni]|uniref:hydroxyacylglutathione hydrolase n=1 Tax=Darwinula stevensoni TaxID=69355 RepID=A0A7R9FPH1_9CRUS|nr:unnamed protein product [Darwinula stevensoni]CAG0897936.1 unnamed protein product [Darwinula stevensoni]